MKWNIYLIFLLISAIFGCQEEEPQVEEDDDSAIAETLPMSELALSDMSSLRTDGDNWSIMGQVSSSFDKEWDLIGIEGTGILVNIVEDKGVRDQAGDGSHIFTNLEHGDIELELEVLVPKGSNSGLYFQGRYELQIKDTAGDMDVSSDDMGGIYAHWKNQDSDQGSDGGHAPKINAARSAGLWQKYHVLFRAPRFDDAGVKITSARFEYVYLNDFLIHENVEVPAPTIEAIADDEVPLAPLMIQGNHGPVAFRNIKYKVFSGEQPALTDLTYKLYLGQYDYIPDFSTLEVTSSGAMENFDDLPDLAGQNDGFNLMIEGKLTVPRSGTYLFETSIDDGGNLYVDDSLVVHNQGEPGGGTERGIIELQTGTHTFRQSYYQEVWGANISVKVEGPEIEKREIPMRAEPKEIPWWTKREDLEIKVGDIPELIRGFVNHYDVKKTHILSVGTSSDLHYSYDTRNNQLINLWKGKFADASRMWNRRGETQRLAPLGAVLNLDEISFPTSPHPRGYSLDDSGLPVFQFLLDDQVISDAIAPSRDGNSIIRKISIDKGKLELPIAAGDHIMKLENGWYSVDNRYYLRAIGNESSWEIRKGQLYASATATEDIAFEIYW